MNKSLYLAQSYSDAWDDYKRSVNGTIPIWDYIVLTASNEHQAESFRKQIDCRRAYLPSETSVWVVADEGDVRVGSGGATLSVLKLLNEIGGWKDKRILVIHSGGDSKRVPQYSALGKLFSPVPHCLPDGRSSTLFDEFIITMSALPARIREGMLLLSGDVILLFNPLLIDWSGKGAASISFRESGDVGKEHGAFLRGKDGNVEQFLHKKPLSELKAVGALDQDGMLDIDTGAILFGTDVLDSLFSLISTDGKVDSGKYHAFVNDKARLSLYGDFQYPLATKSTLDQFYNENPEWEYNEELKGCRKAIWEVLHQYSLKLIRLAPAKFIHFGTAKEILDLMSGGVDEYKDLNWNRSVNSIGPGYNSVISPYADVGEGVYCEVSYVHSGASIGDRSILSYVDIDEETIPSDVVIHGLKQNDGKFVCRIFGINDNPKDNKLFGKTIPEKIAASLWSAPVYPERDSVREAIATALSLYKLVTEDRWDEIEHGKSLASGFFDADTEAILAWDKRMTELVQMNRIASLIDDKSPASEVKACGALTEIQREWLDERLDNSDYRLGMRLNYYMGMASGNESMVFQSFKILSNAILSTAMDSLRENKEARIVREHVEVDLPLRVNWGGGWSDTPPYCNENGGTVLNAAITISGQRPIKVTVKRTEDKKIVLESRDMMSHGEFTDINELQRVGDPFDPFVLQKAALLACGILPASGGSLDEIIDRLGGGIWMDTEVIGIPKGSGLGTSSILSAGCVKALLSFVGVEHTDDDVYKRVLCMEQIMSTGGGWQDQVGGVTDGIKYTTSLPGLHQILKVQMVEPDEKTKEELNQRFTLIYTGQRRLARNLLRDVVGRYIGNESDTVFALNEIQRKAALMKFELERGHIDAFARLLSEHWELSKMIDSGSSNTLIDQIFDSVDDLLEGKMVCGAGGGGFLQVVLKKGISKDDLRMRLKSVFSGTEIDVWECELV